MRNGERQERGMIKSFREKQRTSGDKREVEDRQRDKD